MAAPRKPPCSCPLSSHACAWAWSLEGTSGCGCEVAAGRDNSVALGSGPAVVVQDCTQPTPGLVFKEEPGPERPAVWRKTMSQPWKERGCESAREGKGAWSWDPAIQPPAFPKRTLPISQFVLPFPPPSPPALSFFCYLAVIGKALKNRKCPRQENTLES